MFSASLTDRAPALVCTPLRTTQLIYTRSRRTAPRVPCPVAGRQSRNGTKYQCRTTDCESALRSGASSRNISRLCSRRTERRSTAAPQKMPSWRWSSSAARAARQCLVRFADVVVCSTALRAYSDLVGNVAISLQGVRLGRVGWGASAFLFAIKVSYCSCSSLPICASFFCPNA